MFKMKFVKSHQRPLQRQVHESVEISRSVADKVMNSKGEWGGSKIPRINLEVGERVREDAEEGLTRAEDSKIEKWTVTIKVRDLLTSHFQTSVESEVRFLDP